jgi:hypothetical protein
MISEKEELRGKKVAKERVLKILEHYGADWKEKSFLIGRSIGIHPYTLVAFMKDESDFFKSFRTQKIILEWASKKEEQIKSSRCNSYNLFKNLL